MPRKKKQQATDPVSDQPERSHPVGVGVGAAGGAATGAAIGAVGGPVGSAVGAAVGGIAGGLAGRAVAKAVNPTEEEAYWQEHFAGRPYVDSGADYSTYQPAYRYGWESTERHPGRSFDEAEHDLGRDWERARGTSTLEWDRARHAARDAWQRVRQDDTPTDPLGTPRADDDRYWREHFSRSSWAQNASYEDYAPAFRFGREARARYGGRAFEDAERDLERDWERSSAGSPMNWARVRDAVHAAWHRVERALPGDSDRDGR
jgi:hypothetical protein